MYVSAIMHAGPASHSGVPILLENAPLAGRRSSHGSQTKPAMPTPPAIRPGPPPRISPQRPPARSEAKSPPPSEPSPAPKTAAKAPVPPPSHPPARGSSSAPKPGPATTEGRQHVSPAVSPAKFNTTGSALSERRRPSAGPAPIPAHALLHSQNGQSRQSSEGRGPLRDSPALSPGAGRARGQSGAPLKAESMVPLPPGFGGSNPVTPDSPTAVPPPAAGAGVDGGRLQNRPPPHPSPQAQAPGTPHLLFFADTRFLSSKHRPILKPSASDSKFSEAFALGGSMVRNVRPPPKVS